MGSAKSGRAGFEDEEPQHKVTLAGFWIDRTEVTNRQYRKFIDAGGYGREEYWTDAEWTWKEQENATEPHSFSWGKSNYNGSEQPVMVVSWYEAVAYARWAGARLPSEAEWEKAARGTDGRMYPWGNTWDGTRVNFCDKNCEESDKDSTVDDGYRYPAPVGSYADGASPYGALDLAGNAWEWVSSKYWSYPYNSRDGRESLNGTDLHILRGGNWSSLRAWAVRSANRVGIGPGFRSSLMGFRLVSPGP